MKKQTIISEADAIAAVLEAASSTPFETGINRIEVPGEDGRTSFEKKFDALVEQPDSATPTTTPFAIGQRVWLGDYVATIADVTPMFVNSLNQYDWFYRLTMCGSSETHVYHTENLLRLDLDLADSLTAEFLLKTVGCMGPLTRPEIIANTTDVEGLTTETCNAILDALIAEGEIELYDGDEETRLEHVVDVPGHGEVELWSDPTVTDDIGWVVPDPEDKPVLRGRYMVVELLGDDVTTAREFRHLYHALTFRDQLIDGSASIPDLSRNNAVYEVRKRTN